ncbi:hypothetical protein F4804DRAFT_334401 [Jackrogersella minutella]|nr:hypothetical protein F4804DRAFT_334401 [Jackrogersella minutella]
MARASNGQLDMSGVRLGGRTQSLTISHAGAAAKTQPADVSLEQQELELLGPAYVLEWPDEGYEGCSRKRVNGAEELRAAIQQEEPNSSYFTRGQAADASRLFVIQGLPAEYLHVLRDMLGVDARFLEAHVERRSYRPLARRRADGLGFACFEYPELLVPAKTVAATGDKQTASSVDIPRASVGVDVFGSGPAHVISSDGESAVFCRASLWLNHKNNVLLLDRSAWSQPSSEFRKARYHVSFDPSHASAVFTGGKPNESSTDSNTLHSEYAGKDSDEIPSFETLLRECVKEEWPGDSANEGVDIRTVVEDVAAHQWIEFFEALPMDLPCSRAETAALYWQVQKSLERNLSNSEIRNKPLEPAPSTSPWQLLLSRLSRRVSLLNHLTPITDNFQLRPGTPSSLSPSQTQPLTAAALPPGTPHRRTPSSGDDANQHSLDRVSYMGGVLLPLSIVSSILSMSDPFGPGGSMFFVFWAASVPLVAVTILVIYADSIRKAEVWIEVAGSAVGEKQGSVSMPELEHGNARIMRNRVGHEDEEVTLEEWDEPAMMVEKLFKDAGGKTKKWRKEQLGWLGACKAVFRIYKLKKGRPPNWAVNVKRGNTV